MDRRLPAEQLYGGSNPPPGLGFRFFLVFVLVVSGGRLQGIPLGLLDVFGVCAFL